jgi:catechol 2,3-dioxygenase-like lactoylglutathione lyase family enzyme
MPGTARAFSHLALVVTDLEKVAAFYVDTFGFERGASWFSSGRRVAGLMDVEPDGFDGTYLALGDFRLELLNYRTPVTSGERPRPSARPGFAHISFVVDDLEGTIAAAEASGGAPHRRLAHSFLGPEQTVIAFVLDPDGNRVELIGHPSHEEAVAHANFLGLAGIGWPARAQVEGTSGLTGRVGRTAG